MIDIRGLNKQEIMSALIRNAVYKNSSALAPCVPPRFFRMAHTFFSLFMGSIRRPIFNISLPMLGKGTFKTLTQQEYIVRALENVKHQCPEHVRSYKGIPIYADLTGNTFDCSTYNGFYGKGEGERIVNTVRFAHWQTAYVEQHSKNGLEAEK